MRTGGWWWRPTPSLRPHGIVDAVGPDWAVSGRWTVTCSRCEGRIGPLFTNNKAAWVEAPALFAGHVVARPECGRATA